MERNDPKRAVADFYEMIVKSWTWQRLNALEKENFTHLLLSELESLKGTWKNRWAILNELYRQFLEEQCNYRPIGWRETEEVPQF